MNRFLQIPSQAYFQYLWYIVSIFFILPSASAQTIPATLSWTGETQGIIFSSPVIDDNGIVYVGSNDNNLTAFNTDGSIKWTFTTGNWVDSSPALSKDESTVYAGSWDNHLYAVNTDDGSLNWSFESSSYITSSPAVDLNGRVYFGSMDSIFYALESNGSLSWEYFVGQPVFSSPAIGENGSLYFGDENGTLHAVNPDGTVKWTYEVEDVVDTNKSILSSPAVDTSGNIYFGSGNGFCYSLSDNEENASLNWKYETGDRVDSSPVLGVNDEVFFVSRDGYMRSLPIFSATTENLPNWEVFVGDVFYSTPVVDENGRVYVIGYTGGGENHLFAYDANGTKAWDSNVSSPPFEIPSVVDSSLLLSDDGNLYFGCFDKKLYCLDIGIGPADSDWPMFGRISRRDSDWPSFNLSISANTGGVVTTSGIHYLGTDALISATPDTGYSFAGWTGEGISDPSQASTTVSMTQSRSVSASFLINSYSLTVEAGNGGSVTGGGTFNHGANANISATPETGYSFAGWSGEGVSDPSQASTTVSMTQSRSVSASFLINSYSLTVEAGNGGSVTGSGTFVHGSNPSITATPDTGYSFAGWSGEGVNDVNASITWVNMSAPRSISAAFWLNSYELTVLAGNGGSVTGSGTFVHGSNPSITATPDSGYSFAGWSGEGIGNTNASTTLVSMVTPRTITAIFSLNSYELMVLAENGGSVTGSGTFNHGTKPIISATASNGYTFSGWAGEGIEDPNASTTKVIMSGDRNISALFSLNSYPLTVLAGTGGTVSGAGTYTFGSTPSISATPSMGYLFDSWSGSGVAEPSQPETTVDMQSARNVSASFSLKSYTLNILSGEGGTVSGTGSYPHGTLVQIEATAETGYSFDGWTGEGISDPDAPLTSILMNSDQNISAGFATNPVANYLLSLTVSPTNGGIVSGGGNYQDEQNVSISANPQYGYSFDGWSGYNLINPDEANNSLIIESNISLTALFEPQVFSLDVQAGPGGNSTGSGNYTYLSEVNIMAEPFTGYRFSHWEGNGTTEPFSPETTFSMVSDATLRAIFVPQLYSLVIGTSGNGQASYIGNNPFAYGSSVRIDAVPSTGHVFTGWVGENIESPESSSTTTLIQKDSNITANFEPEEKQVFSLIILQNIIAAGTITGGGFYEEDQYIQISAASKPGYRFSHWLGSGIQNPLAAQTTIFLTSDSLATASFTLSELSNFLDCQFLESQWFSSWLGTIYQTESGWVYHTQLGWLYPELNSSGIWIWKDGLGWLWTNEYIYFQNFLWYNHSENWIYLDKEDENQIRMYNYKSSSWTDWP